MYFAMQKRIAARKWDIKNAPRRGVYGKLTCEVPIQQGLT